MAWIKLSLRVTAESEAHTESLIWAAGASAVTILDAGDHPVLEPPAGTTPVWPDCRIEALFAGDGAAHAIERLREQLTDACDWQVSDIENRDCARAWMDDFKPMRFG